MKPHAPPFRLRLLRHASRTPLWAHLPPPTPDVVPLPPSPHPGPPPPEVPDEINDPPLPGQGEPMRDPPPPRDRPTGLTLSHRAPGA